MPADDPENLEEEVRQYEVFGNRAEESVQRVERVRRK
eukprot:CAMPEP_0168346136 /NCGR_PEP_ID=MMETSP0213-20121227/18060_1 /TAXON_ID=151035 /ORGANISM="Euplotes harpa, Strain FSP1.4" /LENGTH=36 /DNA_ID= /DNA_START= /DNA_END= /DNA_ORIENTATION=